MAVRGVPPNGIRFTRFFFDGHASGWSDSARTLVTWISHDSHPGTSILNWLSAACRFAACPPGCLEGRSPVGGTGGLVAGLG